jgi:RNA recognition motif-containing protein
MIHLISFERSSILFLLCLLSSSIHQVLEVVALRKDGLRGQAFVIFEEAASALEALQKENGLVLFGKPLKIEFSNESVCTKCQNLGFFSSLQKGDGTHCQ